MSSRLSAFSSTAITNHALLLRAISSALYGVNLKPQISNLDLKHYLLQYALISLHGLTGPLSRLLWCLSLTLLPLMTWSSRIYLILFSQALTHFYLIACCCFSLCFNVCYGVNISAVLSAKESSSTCCSNTFLSEHKAISSRKHPALFTASSQNIHRL
jgi:ABC-type uncharacterized transport system permease subunit